MPNSRCFLIFEFLFAFSQIYAILYPVMVYTFAEKVNPTDRFLGGY